MNKNSAEKKLIKELEDTLKNFGIISTVSMLQI